MKGTAVTFSEWYWH